MYTGKWSQSDKKTLAQSLHSMHEPERGSPTRVINIPPALFDQNWDIRSQGKSLLK